MRSRLGELDGCWLHVQCERCPGHTVIPVKRLAQRFGPGRQVGAILPRFTCKRCKARPAEVHLSETHNMERNGGSPPGWSVKLLPLA